jgi:hypothetical protein
VADIHLLDQHHNLFLASDAVQVGKRSACWRTPNDREPVHRSAFALAVLRRSCCKAAYFTLMNKQWKRKRKFPCPLDNADNDALVEFQRTVRFMHLLCQATHISTRLTDFRSHFEMNHRTSQLFDG